MKLIPNALLILIVSISYAQVGVGTTNPTSELEIKTSNTGIPAFEINPQTAPVGSADGQLAVIGDKLYMYDLTRTKWLSVESTTLPYGRDGGKSDEVLRFMGVIKDENSGAHIPMNATIVHISARASGGNTTKDFSLEIRNATSLVSSTSYNLAASEYINSSLNIDINAGQYLIARIGDTGGDVDDLTLIVWLKWRQ